MPCSIKIQSEGFEGDSTVDLPILQGGGGGDTGIHDRNQLWVYAFLCEQEIRHHVGTGPLRGDA